MYFLPLKNDFINRGEVLAETSRQLRALAVLEFSSEHPHAARDHL